MPTTFDNITLKVSLDANDNFIVKDPKTHETRALPANNFLGNLYKYASDFETAFLSAFEGKTAIVFSEGALERIHNLMSFNREDC